MKRLLIALVAAVAVSTGFARLTDTQSFENSFSDFVPDVSDQDDSELVDYDNDGPSFAAPYDFDDFGLKYLSLDTGDATLWRTNAGDAAYFDMAMQFNPCAAAPEIDDDTKIAVYLNSSSNLVVLAGDGSGGTVTNVTGTTLAPGTWGRLTIASVADGFKVTLNTNTVVGTFASRKGDDKTIKAVGFKGSGALDDFVARTTDPFLQNPAATIGGEGYASLADALADDPTATPQLEADASYTIASRGGSVGVKLNNHTLTVTAPEGLYAYPTTSGDVTTYTADYFPRTATAGQDGTAAHPFEVADVDDLQALSAAVAADAATFAGKCYVQTADIDMASAGAFAGVGTYNVKPAEGVAFTGTYDGDGHTISNVIMTARNYGGIFNQVNGGTIKNLTVENISSSATTGEYGYAIVGHAGTGAILTNLVMKGSVCTDANPGTHNCAGIVVRVSPGPNNDNTQVKVVDCENKATIYGNYTKVAGICAITQNDGKKHVSPDHTGTVLFENCVNSGDLMSTGGGDGIAGIVAYTSLDITYLKNCSNTGSLTTTLVGARKGQLVGYAQSKTLEDLGGNSGVASEKMVYTQNGTINGFQYATVDNGVATTVTGALAKDTTYLLERNVAASETPVFTLAAAGDTFKVDTALDYTFAGTVAVDRSTLMPATSETVGTVTTYSATAGVASVDDVAYATFADAVAAVASAPEGKQFVTLLDDIADTFTLTEAGSLAVRRNSHNLTVVGADGLVMGTPAEDPSTGITTYTAVEGVANLNGTWYASFNAAYDAASASTDTLLVKVSSDFAPTLSASKAFASVTFTNESAEAIAIATASGDYAMTASTWVAPATATLTLSANQTVAGITAGTLEVPQGVKITLPNFGYNIAVDVLKGSGRLSCAGRVNNIALRNRLGDAANWAGTMEMTGFDYTNGDIALKSWGNANSTVCFSSVGLKFIPTYNSLNGVKALEIGPGGLTLAGAHDVEETITIPAKVIGTGNLTFAQTGSALCTYNFTGDFSEFAGNLTIGSGAQNRVYIGSNCAGNGACISIANGATATVAAGKTWNSQNGFVVLGTLNVAGTLKHQGGSAANQIYGNTKTGKIVFKNAAAITTFGGSYAGEIVIDSIAAGTTTTQVSLNFGCDAAKLTLNGVSGDAWCAGSDYTVQPEITLAGDVNFQNGSSYKTVTFRKIAAGTGNLSLKTWSGCNAITYGFTTLDADNYTGTIHLDGDKLTFNVGNILKAGVQPGNKVLNLTVANNATVNLAGAKLNGNAVDLELKSDGVYYAETYTVTYNLDLAGATNAVDNITTFTVLTPSFTLLDAGCDGYTFEGWTNAQGTAVTTIAGGATGNVTVYASWTKDEPPTPEVPEIKPGESGSSDCGTAEKAAAAAEAINNDPAKYIKAPTDAGLSGETAEDYADCFSARAEGTSVVVELNAAGTNALEVASTNTAAQVAASLSTIAATSTATEVAVTGAQPGFYYYVVYDDDLSTLDTAGTEGTRALAGANGSVTLAIPDKEQSATAGFYRVKVSVKPSGD